MFFFTVKRNPFFHYSCATKNLPVYFWRLSFSHFKITIERRKENNKNKKCVLPEKGFFCVCADP